MHLQFHKIFTEQVFKTFSLDQNNAQLCAEMNLPYYLDPNDSDWDWIGAHAQNLSLLWPVRQSVAAVKHTNEPNDIILTWSYSLVYFFHAWSLFWWPKSESIFHYRQPYFQVCIFNNLSKIICPLCALAYAVMMASAWTNIIQSCVWKWVRYTISIPRVTFDMQPIFFDESIIQ